MLAAPHHGNLVDVPCDVLHPAGHLVIRFHFHSQYTMVLATLVVPVVSICKFEVSQRPTCADVGGREGSPSAGRTSARHPSPATARRARSHRSARIAHMPRYSNATYQCSESPQLAIWIGYGLATAAPLPCTDDPRAAHRPAHQARAKMPSRPSTSRLSRPVCGQTRHAERAGCGSGAGAHGELARRKSSPAVAAATCARLHCSAVTPTLSG